MITYPSKQTPGGQVDALRDLLGTIEYSAMVNTHYLVYSPFSEYDYYICTERLSVDDMQKLMIAVYLAAPKLRIRWKKHLKPVTVTGLETKQDTNDIRSVS